MSDQNIDTLRPFLLQLHLASKIGVLRYKRTGIWGVSRGVQWVILVLPDQRCRFGHPNTAISALLANEVLAQMNTTLGLGIPVFNDDEILLLDKRC